MANQLGAGKVVTAVVVAVLGSSFAFSAMAAADGKGGVVYRTVDKEGRTVYSDRPLGNSTPIGAYSSSTNAAEIALRERDYWRQRADAFSERQRQRDREFEETRRTILKSEQTQAPSVVVIPSFVGGGSYSVNAGSSSPGTFNPVYETTPGAVRGRFTAPLQRF